MNYSSSSNDLTHHQILESLENHTVAQHNGRIIVWGGEKHYERPKDVKWHHVLSKDELLIYDPTSLSWTKQRTEGEDDEYPLSEVFNTAHVVGDHMYILSDICLEWNVHALNLRTFKWKTLEPSGKRRCDEMPISVLHGDSIIAFTDWFSVIVYDTQTNVRWRPECNGHAPSSIIYFDLSVSQKLSFVVEKYVYIFLQDRKTKSFELFRLDVHVWMWEPMTVKECWSEEENPGDRFGQSLTLLPSQEQNQNTRVLLYGGCRGKSQNMGSSWMLQVNHEESSYHWERCDYLDRGDCFGHQAVVEEGSGQVWLIGGSGHKGHRVKSVLKLTVTRPLSLFMLTLKAMVEEREEKLKEGIEELPRRLREAFDSYVESEKVDSE